MAGSEPTTTGQPDKQERSVGHLQDLYAVVVAIALSLAVDRLVSTASGFHERRLLLSAALLLTIVPFYHGALLHLDDRYAFSSSGPKRGRLVLADFWLLFLESCAFLALAVSIGRPHVFASAFLALLAADVVWSGVTTTLFSGGHRLSSQATWGQINLAAAAAVAMLLVATSLGAGTDVLWYGLPAIALVRTLTDYSLTFAFYVASE